MKSANNYHPTQTQSLRASSTHSPHIDMRRLIMKLYVYVYYTFTSRALLAGVFRFNHAAINQRYDNVAATIKHAKFIRQIY
jgi:hypothetical protein